VEGEKKPFRFLTTEEFNQLARQEKMVYLSRAVAALNEREGGRMGLFADDPDMPPARGE